MADSDARKRRSGPVVALLAAGHSVRATASQTGIGERTIHRWNRDPRFRRRVAAARDALTRETVGRLVDASTRAVGRLVAIVDDPDAPPAVAVAAARTLLDQAARHREQVELIDRIEALEQDAER